MAEGGEQWEIKSELLSEADEAKMIAYLRRTGKYSILSKPSCSTPNPNTGKEHMSSPFKPGHSPYTPNPTSGSHYGFYPPQFPSSWPVYQPPPRISPFSGEEPVPKGENSFENWKFEVRCLMRDDTYSPSTLTQAVRKSLRGDDARLNFGRDLKPG